MKTDPEAIDRFFNEARACAMQLMENAAYIQKQLPSLDMPESLRVQIVETCSDLIGIKHDLIHEIFEIGDGSANSSAAFRLGVETISELIGTAITEIQDCVEAVRSAVNAGEASPLVAMLVMESACNVINATPEHLDLGGDPAAGEDDDDGPEEAGKTSDAAGDDIYSVTPLDNFDWYEGAGVPTLCRGAAQALSVAKGILERSLRHEHAQAKDPSCAVELFKRWDDFGDYPSIRPELDPPFDPSAYAEQRALEICRQLSKGDALCSDDGL